MGAERKYGNTTTERGDIADDEPVFLFRAQDRLLPDVIDAHRQMCEQAGSPPEHLEGLDASKTKILQWQATHATKTPGVPRI